MPEIIESNIITIAHQLADLAGEIARRYFRQTYSLSLKTNQSPVTQADLEIETAIRAYLNQQLPNHGILGEEYGLQQSQSSYLWVIDPIDGTASFASGKPTFCTLIALLKDNQPILGIIDQPITGDRWVGLSGERSTWNGKMCSSSNANILNTLKLSCTTPDMFKNILENKKLAIIKKHASIISYGGDAYAYGLLAAGCIDLIFEADLQFYDVAALIPIIEGAGGVITDWEGRSIKLDSFQGQILAAGNKQLHQEILRSIADNRAKNTPYRAKIIHNRANY